MTCAEVMGFRNGCKDCDKSITVDIIIILANKGFVELSRPLMLNIF